MKPIAKVFSLYSATMLLVKNDTPWEISRYWAICLFSGSGIRDILIDMRNYAA